MDPNTERDGCGVGFVADARGRPSRRILAAALQGLSRLRHRGAVAADARTGDGAGVLTTLPRPLLARIAAEGRVDRPLSTLGVAVWTCG